MKRQRGKKFEVISITEGAHHHDVELRIDTSKGDVFAVLGGAELSAPSLPELRRLLQAKAKEMATYEFRWYIVVEFSVDESYGPGGGSTRSGFDEIRDGNEIIGLNFDFKVVERSQMIDSGQTYYNRKKVFTYLERHVEEVHGELQPQGERRKQTTGDVNDAIEYTVERYDKLVAIRAGIRELARRLHEIVGGKTTDIARVLDAASTQKLLTGGEK